MAGRREQLFGLVDALGDARVLRTVDRRRQQRVARGAARTHLGNGDAIHAERERLPNPDVLEYRVLAVQHGQGRAEERRDTHDVLGLRRVGDELRDVLLLEWGDVDLAV